MTGADFDEVDCQEDGFAGQEDGFAWQEKCVEVWRGNGYRGIVQAVTGAGKTILALKAAECLERDLGRSVRLKIVVPTKSLMYQWANAIKSEKLETEFGGAYDRCLAAVGCIGGGARDSDDRKYMIYVINSARYQLARKILEELDAGEDVLLIADECHHYASGENRRIFDFVPFLPERSDCGKLDQRPSDLGRSESGQLASRQRGRYFSMGLSATLQSGEDFSLLEDALGKKIFHYSLARALRYGTVCDFVIFQIAVPFLSDELDEYERLSEEIHSVVIQLCANNPLLKERGTAFFAVVQKIAEGETGKLSKLARAYLALVYQRKRIVCMAENRLACAVKLLDMIGAEKQCIIFGESTVQADAMYERLKPVMQNKVGRYHSKMGHQENRNALERFRNGEVKVLVSCKALDEGIDVPDTEIGIVLSGTSMERQRLQRLGRLLRNSSGKKCAKLYYLFAKESHEEKAYFAGKKEGFKTIDMEFHVEDGNFFCPDYESRVEDILDKWDADQLGRPFKDEALRCFGKGMLEADWMLEEERLVEQLNFAENERAKNYWLCMLEMRRNLALNKTIA